MGKWEYITLRYVLHDPRGARWVITPADPDAETKQVGKAEKRRFAGRIMQGLRLLEIALEELDADGWELVSASFDGIMNLYGTAFLRRPKSGQS